MVETALQPKGFTDVPRNARGHWLPGHRGGPGRRKGEHDFRAELIKALREVEKRKRESIFQRAWEMAWDDATMMAALLRKLLPDLQHQTGTTQPVHVSIHYGHLGARTTITQPEPTPIDA